MNEGVPQNESEKIRQICSEFGIEIVNDCADLAHLSFEETMSFLKELVNSGNVVLHGTNSDEVYKCLETRQGHCVIKESGRKKAVYATEMAITALAISVLNRKYLRSKLPGYPSSHSSHGDEIKFKFPKGIYELFEAHDPNIFADGYVYALDKSKFVNAEDAGSEWHSESDQEPILACKISGELGKDVYIVGTENNTVFEYE